MTVIRMTGLLYEHERSARHGRGSRILRRRAIQASSERGAAAPAAAPRCRRPTVSDWNPSSTDAALAAGRRQSDPRGRSWFVLPRNAVRLVVAGNLVLDQLFHARFDEDRLERRLRKPLPAHLRDAVERHQLFFRA